MPRGLPLRASCKANILSLSPAPFVWGKLWMGKTRRQSVPQDWIWGVRSVNGAQAKLGDEKDEQLTWNPRSLASFPFKSGRLLPSYLSREPKMSPFPCQKRLVFVAPKSGAKEKIAVGRAQTLAEGRETLP